MTLQDWQQAPKLITAWREMVDSEVFKKALEVMAEVSPSKMSTTHNADHSNRNASVLFGQVQGYEQALRFIKILAASPTEQPRQPIANYGAQEEEQK